MRRRKCSQSFSASGTASATSACWSGPRARRGHRVRSAKIIHRALAGEARYAERFLRETKLVARVAHPNIVRLYDAGATANGRLFMVMERVFGVSLRQMMAGGARLDGVRALHYAIQIADALATAHEAELVHRDVKPENVMVSDGVHAWLLDFGVAKDARGARAGPGNGLTRQGAAVGTSRYMAPEQVAGSSAVDARADLYALGVVLYEMLAGAHPYAELDAGSGIGETEILAAHVHLEARPLPEVLPGCPEALWQAVATCLAKRPEERFARAGELAEELRAVAQRMLSAGTAAGRSAAGVPGLSVEMAPGLSVEMAPGQPVEMVAGLPAEEGSARRLRREVADAARAKVIRGSVPREGNEEAGRGRGPRRGPVIGDGRVGAHARSKLAMAQRFEVAPACGLGVVSAGEGAVSGDAALGKPWLQVLPVDQGGAAESGAAGQGEGATGRGAEAGTLASTEKWERPAAAMLEPSTLASTEKWERPAAAMLEPSTLASTEKWAGAEAVLRAMAGGERLARTEPWDGAKAGAGMVARSAALSRTRRRLVVVGALVFGLAAGLLAVVVVVVALAWR